MFWAVSYLFIFIADIDVNPSLSPKLVTGSPEVNQPFSIPCFDDVDNQLFPRNAAKFTDIAFNWELSVGSSPNAAYPADVAQDPSRIKVDPVTGGFEKLSFSLDLVHVCKLLCIQQGIPKQNT